MEGLKVALFLAVANRAVVNAIAAPVRKRFPEFDLWFLVYVALATGAGLSWASGVNMFSPVFIPNELVARVLTAIVIGGGSSLIHELSGILKPPSE